MTCARKRIVPPSDIGYSSVNLTMGRLPVSCSPFSHGNRPETGLSFVFSVVPLAASGKLKLNHPASLCPLGSTDMRRRCARCRERPQLDRSATLFIPRGAQPLTPDRPDVFSPREAILVLNEPYPGSRYYPPSLVSQRRVSLTTSQANIQSRTWCSLLRRTWTPIL